jgi:hypothetical protein
VSVTEFNTLSRDDAALDVLELGELLASSHPDPYTAIGGPIAFRREIERIIAELPASVEVEMVARGGAC